MSLCGPGATILSAASRTTIGRPNDKSSMQTWQQFFKRAQVRQMLVRFCLLVRSALNRKTVKGRLQILHSAWTLLVRASILRRGSEGLHHGRPLASGHTDCLEDTFRRQKGSLSF